MDKFKLRVTLNSGKTVTCRFRAHATDLDEVFDLIKRCWREGAGGYVTFGNQTFQMKDISHYTAAKSSWWLT